MEPKSNAPTRLTDRKRAAILEAGAEEFQSQGYLCTSMDRVAARAGVSKRTVYNHFASKEALFRAIAAHVWRQAIEATDIAYDPAAPLAAQLIEIGATKLRLLRCPDYLSMMRAVMGECLRTPERAKEVFGGIWSDEDSLAKWMKQAMQDGRLAQVDPHSAAEQFWGLVKYPVFLPMLFGLIDGLPDEEILAVVKRGAEMFLSHHELVAEN